MSYQFILEHQGKQGFLTPVNGNWIKDHLGISHIENDMKKMSDLFRDLVLVPHQKEKLLEWLKDHPDLKGSEIRTCNNDIMTIAWNIAFRELIKEGKVIPTSHGRGRERTWRVKDNE